MTAARHVEHPPRDRPLLVWDGECGFCAYWIRYWRQVTGARLDYAPLQEAAQSFPEIPLAEFRRAVQHIDTDGRVTSGAGASFRALALAPRHRLWLWLYRRLPGFAPLSEGAYTFVSRRRGLFHRLSRLLFGAAPEPPSSRIVCRLFLRGLALVYLAAFVSFAVQARGLIGAQGILPLGLHLEQLAAQYGAARFQAAPMVFWLGHADWVITLVAWAGAAGALLAFLGLAPRAALLLAWLLYLSLVHAGQAFMSFQWDVLLLEAGFLALFLGNGNRVVVWLYRWLAFRCFFVSGWVKLASGDSAWADLSALEYHFETQPLPTPLAWYAHHLPDAVLRFATGATLAVELILPFCIFLPRRIRYLAAGGFAAFQSLILLTGNYNFFNLLAILLCLLLLDDAAVRGWLPRRLRERALRPRRAARHPRLQGTGVGLLAAGILALSGLQLWARLAPLPPPAAVYALLGALRPLHLTSVYGPFAVMTRRRDEIVLEGSADGRRWRRYEFRYKPDDVGDAPSWIIPHQPRLDWQMWFAALSSYRRNPWFVNFAVRLLQGAPEVLALLRENPFPGQPPRYVRAVRYRFRFTDREAGRRSGRWWTAERVGIYMPAARLGGGS